MEALRTAREAGDQVDLAALIDAIPYAKFLGITVDQKGTEITTVLKFNQQLIGNPVLPALHGGVIGAFLETTAIIQLAYDAKGDALPKPVDITIDYLRSGKPVDTYARARVTKHGRRVANVQVEAWQDDRTKPIAAAHGHFLLAPPPETGQSEG
ncbi:PaaI family thioesterase [Tepidicaulis sp. LMO-SS28]|uniref:PaaI family thioesterase n=1 Tax=Tepidicaulis sp. LMO-SS28 TaxID=3447455 RepID=UPI003EDEEC60